MKKSIISIFCLTFFLATAVSQKQYAYLIECVSVETSGTSIIKIWNSKKGKKYSVLQARKDAIYAVLYHGVPGNNGCIAQKPLLSSAESIESFNRIKNRFFANEGIWYHYANEATIINSLPELIKENDWKIYQVSISKDLLRKYLEEQKIINSLNSGF